VDELLGEAQREKAAAGQLTPAPPQSAAPQPQPQQPAARPQQGGHTFDWHLAEIARLEREASILPTNSL
jgi:hypothetical protein